VLLCWAAAALLATFGVARLQIETTVDSVLDRSGEPWVFYERSKALFGGDEIVVLLVQGDEPWSVSALEAVRDLTSAAQRIPGVRRVDSVSSLPVVWVTGEGVLELEPPVPATGTLTPRVIDEARARLQADRLARGNVVAVDGRSFGVNVFLESEIGADYARVLDALSDVSSDVVARSGVPVFREATTAETQAELAIFVPITVAGMCIVLWCLFRSWRAVLVPLAVSGIGSWVLLGVMGSFGAPLTVSSAILPSILLALGCAYSMHVLVAAAADATRDVRATRMAEVALPVALSGLTTAIGLAAIGMIEIEAIRQVGGFGALGVLIVLLSTLTAVPAALTLLPLPRSQERVASWLREVMVPRIVAIVRDRRRGVLFCWLGVAAASGAGAWALKVESDVIVWFSKDHEVRQDYAEIREQLSGISPMNVVVEAQGASDLASPEAIRQLAGLTEYLQELPSVGWAASAADPLRQLKGELAADVHDPLPSDRAEIEQYLLLLESVPAFRDLISVDRMVANIPVRVNENGSVALMAIAERVGSWWEEHGEENAQVRVTGIMYEFARAEEAIAWGQIRGLALALGVVAVLLIATFRSLQLGILGLIPNLVPLLVSFGAMGWLEVPLDAGTVLIGNLALGIAVDDSIHLLEAYSRPPGAIGEDGSARVEFALLRVASPIVYTTLAVGVGFAVLGFSPFLFIRNLGLLTAGVLFVCLVADLVLLPALLLRPSGRAITRSRLKGGGAEVDPMGRGAA